MPEDVHPGSFVGDTVEEFKKLPPWGKALALGVFVVVAYLGYRAYASNKSSGAGLSMQGNLQPTNTQTAGSSPFPQVSSGDTSVPLLPSGVNPVFNTSGGLVGYQSQATTPPSQVGATPNSPSFLETIRARFTGNTQAYDQAHPEGIPIRSSPDANGENNVIGTLAYGSVTNASSPIQGGGNFGPKSGDTSWYQVQSNGKTGYVSGHDIEFTPQVQQNTSPNTGGGGISWQSRVYRLTHYTPQAGDNMNEVSRKLGYDSWKDLGQDSFTQGERFKLP